MNKFLTVSSAAIASLLSFAASAAPGEYWEVTSKMEMPGMPFAMPGTTTKVCIAKGGEKDPGKSTGDKDCQATDVKTVGNKTIWKMRCDHDGDVMTGSGEQTTNANGYNGKMQFSSSSQKRGGNMTMVFSGKRVGGNCDSGEMVKKAQADQQKMMGEMCDTSGNHSTADWIRNSSPFIQKGTETLCPAQRKQLCDLVRKDAPRDVEAYSALADYEQQVQQSRGVMVSMAKACKLDMAAATKSNCKKFNGDNYQKLSAHCPAEAKRYREVQRRKDCEGREYTAETRAEDLKRCLSGKDDDSGNENDEGYDEDRSQNKGSASNKSGSSSNSNPAADMLEGAKKLKGMFGF
jgi:hypothetical protein